MKAASALALCFLLAQSPAFADVLKMKSGETKEGRILAESEGQVLFQKLDGTVQELPANDISIMDRSEPLKKGGSVSFYTTSPRKERKRAAKPLTGSASPAETPAAPESAGEAPKQGYLETVTYEYLDKMLQEWLEKHPETKAWLEEAAEKSAAKSNEMNEVLNRVKQQAS